MSSSKPRIAWFCALDPYRSSSAYFTQQVLPLIKDKFEIDIFTSAEQLESDYTQDYYRPVQNYLSAVQRHRAQAYDIFFYQIEDNPISEFVRQHLLLKPGVCLFHNFFLAKNTGHYLANSPWQNTIENYLSSHFEWIEQTAEELNQIKKNEYKPYAQREVPFCQIALFSNDFEAIEAHRLIKKRIYTESKSYYLPLAVKIEQAKPLTGIIENICYTGVPSIEDRAHKFLKALESFPDLKLHWLLDNNDLNQAQELLKRFKLQHVNLIADKNPQNWQKLISKLKTPSLAVHTHYSVFGQPGVYLALSLAQGLGCIVNNFAGTESLPNDLVFKVDISQNETAEYKAILENLNNFDLEKVFEKNRKYAQELYSRENVAKELSYVFEKNIDLIKKQNLAWDQFEMKAYKAMLKMSERCISVNKFDAVIDPKFILEKSLLNPLADLGLEIYE